MYWKDGAPWTPTFEGQLAIERSNQNELERVLQRLNPDVVSVWHMGALSLSLLTTLFRQRVPLVYSICDDWLIYGLDLDPWSRSWQRSPFRRVAGRLAEAVLGVPTVPADIGSTGYFGFISHFTMEASRSASPWSFPMASVVYAGIDQSRFPGPGSTVLKPWDWRLLYMGRLDPRKGIDTLLHAMAKLPKEATLSLFGRGEPAERARIESVTSGLGLADRVQFGYSDSAEVANTYMAHDCAIFPSEWSEPFGLVPLEAMASGVPVVATGVGGSGEYLLDRENCLLFTPGDADGLASAVTLLSKDDQLRHTLHNRGLESAAVFGVERMADSYEVCLVAGAERRLDQLEHQPSPQDRAVSRPGRDVPPPKSEESQRVRARLADVRRAILVLGSASSAHNVSEGGTKRVVWVGDALHDVQRQMADAERNGTAVLGVVSDTENLPFRDGAFAGIVCQETLERVDDDRAVVLALSRLCAPAATVVLVTPNRHSATIVLRRVQDWWKGWSPEPARYYRSPSQRRDYSWSDLENLVEPAFRLKERVPIGWSRTWWRRLASRMLVGPLGRMSHSVMIEITPR
jgi:glycosyltransferase involved in cell wall biosynthesis